MCARYIIYTTKQESAMTMITQDVFFDAIRFSQATSMALLRTQERMVGGLLDIVSSQTAWMKPTVVEAGEALQEAPVTVHETAEDVLEEVMAPVVEMSHTITDTTDTFVEAAAAQTEALAGPADEVTAAPKKRVMKAKAAK
jgi:hypothetical protein